MHLRPIGCLVKLGAKRAELVQKSISWSRVRISRRNAPDPPHWILNSCFGPFRTILVHLGWFGAKRAELVQNFVTRSRVRMFRNERTQSTPLDPKLKFLHVSYYFGAFRTVWLPYKIWCKTGRTSSKVRAMKSRRNFSQWPHLIHPIGP